MFILIAIVVVAGSAVPMHPVEFSTKDNCQSALVMLAGKIDKGSATSVPSLEVKGVCVPR